MLMRLDDSQAFHPLALVQSKCDLVLNATMITWLATI
jgi:hypothetical protein